MTRRASGNSSSQPIDTLHLGIETRAYATTYRRKAASTRTLAQANPAISVHLLKLADSYDALASEAERAGRITADHYPPVQQAARKTK